MIVTTLLALAALPSFDCDTPACAVEIPPGVYTSTRTIKLCKQTFVRAYGATIRFEGVGGVVFARGDGCDSQRSVWSGGLLELVNTATTARPLPVGVDIHAGGVVLRDVQVSRFARNVQAICPSSSNPDPYPDERALGFAINNKAHCNSISLDKVWSSSAWLDGIYFRGSDANAGVMSGVSSVHSCSWADSFLDGPPDINRPTDGPICANFRDDSFLGNTWLGTHSAASYDFRTPREPGEPKTRWFQYFSRSSNGRTTWIGPYAEGSPTEIGNNNGRSYLLGYGHLVFGGLDNIESPRGMTIGEWGAISKASFANRSDHDTGSSLCLGACDGTGSVFMLRTDNGPEWGQAEFRLQLWDDGWTELEAGRATANRILQIWTGDNSTRERGTVRMLKPSLLPHCPDAPHGFLDEAHQFGYVIDDVDGRAWTCKVRN
jgi:hypothetical protein